MKIKSTLFLFIVAIAAALATGIPAGAQQYKLRQTTAAMSMKSESTIYVKGMRKRTEGGGYLGMTNPTTIEQCDLQRTIKINDKKKLYYIEPFAKETGEIIDEDAKPAAKAKPVTASATQSKKTGGVITMWYSIVDTGERKKMYGLTARHIWTTQKMKPSADACTMKDSMIIKTDGWYIDLPQFNCPIDYSPATTRRSGVKYQPECTDRFVTRRSGKGKLGFPLIETKTMIMGNGPAQTTNFETSIETLEFSTAKLDSMLFEIPLGYEQTMNEEDLQDKLDVNAMMNQSSSLPTGQAGRKQSREERNVSVNEPKKPGTLRVGVYSPKGNEQVDVSVLQQHLVNALMAGNTEAVAVSTTDEAKKYNCDVLLSTDFVRIKQGNKIGGVLKAIKNTDPASMTSFNIEASLTLANISDGAIRSQQKISGKYEGKIDIAAAKALDEGCHGLLKDLN
ncbi:MAG TPA: hypothetical protein VFD56_14870 [Chitinophagaceae bacterium]|nr:hypothetical protein [Chitinophagaceae bacterium]